MKRLLCVLLLCFGSSVSACQSESLFPQTFASGVLSFTYPEGWQLQSPEANIQLLGTSESAIKTVFQDNLQEPIASGEQTMAIVVSNYQQDLNIDNYAVFLTEFLKSIETGSNRVSPADPREIGPYRWDIFNLTSNGMRGAIYVYDVGDNARAIVALAIAPTAEYEEMVTTADRVLASLRYEESPSFAQSTDAPREPIAANSGAPLDSLTYVRAQYYEDVIGEEIGLVDRLIISPDGQSLAWIKSRDERQICIQAVKNGAPSCISLPENFRSPTSQFIWSPDGRYIAFTENFFINDSDVWLYEVQTGAIVNRTDDNIDQFPFGDNDVQGPLWIDGPLAWGPDGYLYFMRVDIPNLKESEFSTQGLYRLQPDSGEVTPVRDLSGVFEINSVSLKLINPFDGPIAVSPDGTQIAFIVHERDRSSTKSGVWVLALDGEKALKQVVRNLDLRGGLPASKSENDYSTPSGLAWSEDGKSIFVFGESYLNIIYRIRLDDLAVDVLTDYSMVTKEELSSYNTPLIDTVPRSAVMSSDRSAPLIMSFSLSTREAKIEALIPTETGAERRLLFTISDFEPPLQPLTTTSMATNGVFILLGYVFFPAP